VAAREFQFVQPLPAPPEGATRLYVVFNVTRALIDKREPIPAAGLQWIPNVALSLDRPATPGTDPLPNVVAFQILAPPPGGHARGLKLRAFGEPPEPVKLVFRRGTRSTVFASRGAPCADTEDLWRVDSELPVDRHVFGPAEFLQALEARIAGAPPERQQALRFFLDLDRRTSLVLAQQGQGDLIQAQGFVLPALIRSVQRRHRSLVANGGAYAPLQHDVAAAYLSFYTKIFWDLLLLHFPSAAAPAGPLPALPPDATPENWFDLAAFEQAFEAFADGALRQRIRIPDLALLQHYDSFASAWATQPSSGYFFLFGELALVAAELGVHAEFWTRLSHVMVRSQHLFAERYQPRKPLPAGRALPMMTDYHGCNFRAGPTAAIPAGYAGKRDLPSLSIAAADNAHSFLGGEVAAPPPA
jgi:hypothetical protein